MAEDTSQAQAWESSRVSQPVDFPSILFTKLSLTINDAGSPLGSKTRHRHLQDLMDILIPYADDVFREDVKKAARVRDLIIKRALEPNGHVPLISAKEAVDAHQRLWLQAIMRLSKRRNLLGEDWVRG